MPSLPPTWTAVSEPSGRAGAHGPNGLVVAYYPDGGLPANDPERRQWYREDRPHLQSYLAELYGEDFSRWAK